ncbi:MAG TPA: 50S ribosomal protein L15 [Candidatus Saccharibacteria bacterium]|jgi:large subunit ribosomal protein L15|nr:50S ribosomal protein L15 [Candidatus Saccharibacteria bacterium]
MKINEIERKSNKKNTRVGRGISAGKGKTAGRGTKGQKSRTGKKLRIGFEGGQVSFAERLPKTKGFKSFKPKAETIYTGGLESIKAKVIDNFILAEAGLISNPYVKVKLILKGIPQKALSLKVQHASEGARKAIEDAGGNIDIVERLKREKSADKS